MDPKTPIYRSQAECIDHAIRLAAQLRMRITDGIVTPDANRFEWEESVARIYAVERWTDLR